MLVVISPAKRLDWTVRATRPLSEPAFLDDANALASIARQLSVGDLRRLMGLSADLAQLNHARFSGYSDVSDPEQVRPAALAFAGDTYSGLRAGSLTEAEMSWAQDHLRILSGLYGLLRPMDAIQPYRLEMGSRLKNDRGAHLYAFLGDRLSCALNAQAKVVGTGLLLNCASQEYFGAVDPEALDLDVISPSFLEEKDGTSRTVSFFAKKARGAMARFVVSNRITQVKELTDFDFEGYAFDPMASTFDRPVFRRPYPQPVRLGKAG